MPVDDLLPDGPGGDKKPLLIAGGIALLAFGYMYWRNKQNAAAAATSNTASAYGAPTSGNGVIEPILLTNNNNTTNPPAQVTTNTPITVTAPPSPPSIPTPTTAGTPTPAGTPAASVNGPFANMAATIARAMGGNSNLVYIGSPAQSIQLQNSGYNLYQIGNADYYNKNQGVVPGAKGGVYHYLSTPAQVVAAQKKGSRIAKFGTSEWTVG